MDRPTFDIATVVSGAQRGDPLCFDELIDAYADRLYGYFYRSTGSCAAAEDLVQDVFLRLIEAIKRYDHRERLLEKVFVAARIGMACQCCRVGFRGCVLRFDGWKS